MEKYGYILLASCCALAVRMLALELGTPLRVTTSPPIVTQFAVAEIVTFWSRFFPLKLSGGWSSSTAPALDVKTFYHYVGCWSGTWGRHKAEGLSTALAALLKVPPGRSRLCNPSSPSTRNLRGSNQRSNGILGIRI